MENASNSGVFSAAHKDIMEGLLGHIFIWGIIVLVCSLSIILFLCWLLLPNKKNVIYARLQVTFLKKMGLTRYG